MTPPSAPQLVLPLTLAAALSLVIMAAAPASAQRHHVVADAVQCAGCSIVIGEPVRLRGTDADLGPVTHLGEDSRGNLFATVLYDSHVVAVYDRSGRRTATLGRRGEGPGEFQAIRFLRIQHDTLFVHDSRLGRQTVFFGNEVARTRRVPANAWDWISLPAGGVLNALIPDGSPGGAPLHRLAADGTAAASAGGTAALPRPDEAHLLRRTMAPSAGTGFWAAHQTRYLVERWGPDLRLVERFERRPDWFAAHASTGFPPDRPPQPRVRSIHEDEAGRLWVLLHVASTRWRQTMRDGAFDGRMDLYYDSVIEVIDTRTGSLVARQRIDGYACAFTTRGKLVVYGEEHGEPYLDVLPLTLRTGR